MVTLSEVVRKRHHVHPWPVHCLLIVSEDGSFIAPREYSLVQALIVNDDTGKVFVGPCPEPFEGEFSIPYALGLTWEDEVGFGPKRAVFAVPRGFWDAHAFKAARESEQVLGGNHVQVFGQIDVNCRVELHVGGVDHSYNCPFSMAYDTLTDRIFIHNPENNTVTECPGLSSLK